MRKAKLASDEGGRKHGTVDNPSNDPTLASNRKGSRSPVSESLAGVMSYKAHNKVRACLSFILWTKSG